MGWRFTPGPTAGVSYFFNPAVQCNTTVNGTDALGQTVAMRRNRFPSAVTSPMIAREGV